VVRRDADAATVDHRLYTGCAQPRKRRDRRIDFSSVAVPDAQFHGFG